MAALNGSSYQSVDLQEAGSKGMFQWSSANLASAVSNDLRQAIYVPPASDPTGASGAWVRRIDGPLKLSWWRPAKDGSTDDTTVFNQATQYALGVGTKLVVQRGDYSVDGVAIYDGVQIEFEAGSRLIQPDAGTVTAGNVIYGTGSINVPSGVALTSNATNGNRNVVVGVTTGFAAGDYVLVRDNDYVFPSTAGRNQEVMRVESTDATNIYFTSKLTTGFTTANGAMVYKLNPIRAAKITGDVEIIIGLNRQYGIHLVYPVGCLVGEGVTVQRPRSGGGIVFETGYQSHVVRAKVANGQVMTSGLGYGVAFSESCTWCSVRSSRFENVRENTFTLRTRWCWFEDNTCDWIIDTGWNTHGAGSDYNICRNNTFRDCNQGVAVGWDGATRADNNNLVENNLIYRCVNGVLLSGRSDGTQVGGGNIAKGNTIKSCTGVGVLAYQQSGYTIKDQTIHDSNTMTIAIQAVNCSGAGDISSNNIFELFAASAIGVRLDNTVDATVAHNRVRSLTGVSAIGYYVPNTNSGTQVLLNSAYKCTTSNTLDAGATQKFNSWN